MEKARIQRRKVIIIMISFALACAFFLAFGPLKKLKVDFYVLKPIDLSYTILANCTVDHPKPLDMTFLENGIIQAVEVKDGDRVKKGQRLVLLDDFEAKRNLTISADNLKAAQLRLKNAREEILPNLKEKLKEYEVNLEQAKMMLARYKSIEAAGGISKAELEKAEKEYQKALSQYNQQKLELESFSQSGRLADLESQVSISQAQYELAIKRLENTRILAPFNGTVLKVHVQPGQKVTTATKGVTILEDANWQLLLNVDQKELPFLKPGLSAQIIMDAYPEKKIEGKVSYVCTEVDKEKNTCELRVEISEDAPFIKYGMAGKAEILAATYKNVLALPSRFIKRDTGNSYVWVWEGKKGRLYELKIKPVGERWVLVENLPEGTVILDADLKASPAKLRPGRQVTFPF